MGACFNDNKKRKLYPQSNDYNTNAKITNNYNYNRVNENNNILQKEKMINKNNFKNENEINNINSKIKEEDINTIALNEHNKYRKEFNVPQLRLNKELCNLAQKYADLCAETQSIDHCPYLFNGDIIGENIFESEKNEKINILEICNSWYNEKNYSSNINKYDNKTCHFSQMILKETKEVGFGLSQVNEGKSYFVVYYFPRGNLLI